MTKRLIAIVSSLLFVVQVLPVFADEYSGPPFMGTQNVKPAPVGLPASINSVRPQNDTNAEEQFDRLESAIEALPFAKRAMANQTLVEAANDLGPAVFDGYLSSEFLNTWTGKYLSLRAVVRQLAEGDLAGFGNDALGIEPLPVEKHFIQPPIKKQNLKVISFKSQAPAKKSVLVKKRASKPSVKKQNLKLIPFKSQVQVPAVEPFPVAERTSEPLVAPKVIPFKIEMPVIKQSVPAVEHASQPLVTPQVPKAISPMNQAPAIEPVPTAERVSQPLAAPQNPIPAPADFPVVGVDSIRPQRDTNAEEQFNRLESAINTLPPSERNTANQTLVEAANDLGCDMFDAYLSSKFMNTWTGKALSLRAVVNQLAEGDLAGFKSDALGTGPFEE